MLNMITYAQLLLILIAVLFPWSVCVFLFMRHQTDVWNGLVRAASDQTERVIKSARGLEETVQQLALENHSLKAKLVEHKPKQIG